MIRHIPLGPQPAGPTKRRAVSLGSDERQEYQDKKNDDRGFRRHADKAFECLFLYGNIHFTVLMFGHFCGPFLISGPD